MTAMSLVGSLRGSVTVALDDSTDLPLRKGGLVSWTSNSTRASSSSLKSRSS
jgi:hypothetical protein